MVKYYVDGFSVYKTDDDGRNYTYYKSSDEWREVFPKSPYTFDELVSTTDDFDYKPYMDDELLEHFKEHSVL